MATTDEDLGEETLGVPQASDMPDDGRQDPLKGRRLETWQAGFTIIEIAIALAILSGVVVSVLTTLNYHMDAADAIKSTNAAAILAREKAEEINMQGLPSEKEGVFEDNPGYKWSYVAEDMEGLDVTKIYVTVAWSGGKVVMETYR